MAAPARRRRVPRQAEPHAQEAEYLRALLRLLTDANTTLTRHLLPVLDAYAREQRQRGDGWRADADGWGEEFKRAIRAAARSALAAMPNAVLARLARKMAGDVSDFQRQQLRRQFAAMLGIDVLKAEPDLRPTVEAFTKENVALIKSIPEKWFGQIETQVVEALSSGVRAEPLAKQIQKRYGVAKSRAAFIARDQVGKLYASVDRERQQANGVTHYTWRTANDNRVRPEHRSLNGERFAYDKPHPKEGHPGTRPLCRCFQDPDVDSALAALLGEPTQQRLPPRDTPARPRTRTAAPPASPPPAPTAQRAATPRKGWNRSRAYEIALEELDDLVAVAWNASRVPDIERGFREERELPPIDVLEFNGVRELSDGNHRLATARRLGLKTIRVRFLDKKAAETRPNRPKGTHVMQEKAGAPLPTT